MITEVGGTVGDIEILPFLEAIRQLRLEMPAGTNVCYVHVTLVPFIGPSSRAEDQTDPALGDRAAQSRYPTGCSSCAAARHRSPTQLKQQDLEPLRRSRSTRVVNAPDARRACTRLPLVLHEEGLDGVVCRLDCAPYGGPPARSDTSGRQLVAACRERQPRRPASASSASTSSLPGCLPFGRRGAQTRWLLPRRSRSKIDWIQAEEVEGLLDGRPVATTLDGIVIPGGFGERGIEGKIAAATLRPRTRHPVPRDCASGMQVDGDRFRPQRAWA